MATYYKPIDQFKNYDYYLPQRIGPGALGNDQIKMCKICSQHGYHKEPIVYQNHNGKWIPLNYYDGQRHQHKYPEVNSE